MDLVRLVWTRLTTNTIASFETMTLQKWIRVVIVVGAYLLLRPLLIHLGKKSQMASHEAAEETAAEMSPNELRGKVEIPDESEDEAEAATAETSSADWGKKARRRQRKFLKDMLDAEEKKLQETLEEEEDKDIEQYLT